MMGHKRVGFFFELSIDEQRDRLSELRRSEAHPDEVDIVRYLSAGVNAGVSMVVEEDILHDPPIVLGEALLRSDGEWIWPASLLYYVREYHLELPNEFVEWMRKQQWTIPANLEFVPDIPEGHVEM